MEFRGLTKQMIIPIARREANLCNAWWILRNAQKANNPEITAQMKAMAKDFIARKDT